MYKIKKLENSEIDRSLCDTIILNNKEEAAYVLNDLETLNNNKNILF